MPNNQPLSFAQPCKLCGESCFDSPCICRVCLTDLPFIKQSCNSCGLPLETGASHCGQCISSPPPVHQCISLLHYEAPVDYLIKHMKYQNQLSIADLMGHLLIQKIKEQNEPLPEQIIPIPLHIDRLKQRGYNQAIEIARPISRAFNIPVNLTDFTRIKATQPQFDLAVELRSNNMKNAFEVSDHLKAKHVAILDDILTTGNTVWAASEALLKAGVERIDVWTCARATLN